MRLIETLSPRKMTSIILLIFFNVYPVIDAFGTGHKGGNVFLIPPSVLFFLSYSLENSGVAGVRTGQGWPA